MSRRAPSAEAEALLFLAIHAHNIAALRSKRERKNMNPYITPNQPNGAGRTAPRKTRKRRPLPPQATRDWMTANETALALGCSVATLHRLRRGVIPGVEQLPCSKYGKKFVFRKASIARWRDDNEQRVVA